jgi:hypothetical protein
MESTMKHQARRYAWLITMAFFAGTTSAQAQRQATTRPWERGVSAEDRRAAEMLFDHAVELHEQLLQARAVARYEEALALWENPHIRWNLALLMNDMGQYLPAHAHLERALAWGPEALDQSDWRKLTRIRQMLLRERLAVVEARCDQPDAEVALDGKPWFRGPGVAHQVVLPGEHVITARKPGYFPLARNIVLPAGAQGAVTVAVAMSMDGIFERRRWPSWKPWTVLGGGAAVGLVGLRFNGQARAHLAEVRRLLHGHCDGKPPPCLPVTSPAYQNRLRNDPFATGAMATAGVAVAAAGLVLVFLNQPRSYRPVDRGGATFELTPIASPGAAGISARLRF